MHLVGWFIWISAFLVHVEGIDTDFLTEEQEQEEQEQKKGACTHFLTTDDDESTPCLPIKNNEEIFLLHTAIMSSG